ncbi:hypothetical protein ES319_D05G169400v1 [Gossypium barbadense]|uniref:Protein kinase domain-containing protein n=3 Tax=Gossypium TaxID=3633 RepID=A0A5J5RE47_GOSBA|nr:hypothetical protein ES319_D05G169400v1 [Gossypium barbadense]TYG68767.1 hypothetical protein ES288_D05G179300v1 [Gossypium darwinii]TYH71331.1 hypothetical protein ES332_D05G178700v1 [Gossypium tomentosum]
MSEEANSWIRRTKFSHTVCHRLDSSRLGSFPLNLQSARNQDRSLGSKPRSTVASSIQKPVHNDPQIQPNPITNKQRSVSPVPQTVLPDTFKEAKSERRRSSTPHPQRKESEKRRVGKFFHKESHQTKRSGSPAPSSISSPLRHLGSLKVSDRSKGMKESAWTKYFDHAGGRVNAVDAADEHTVDLSQLFLGLRFAHGAHSRLYHGIYKEEAVAVKIIRVPDDDNGDLATRLEKQFDREVNLLSRLHHQNVIKDFHMKIADFGIACEEAYCDLLADDPGTYRWMAPEMIKRKSYGRKVDVYSFGLMLWELVAGTIPYEDMNPIQAAFAVVNKNLRPAIPKDCPPAMRALIEQCWSLNPEKRPEFWQIVKVLEQFESSLNRDGTLDWVPNPNCQDHKKGLLHWVQKLSPTHNPHFHAYASSPMPKPKFS